MRKRKWDAEAAESLTWRHGDYWPLLKEENGQVSLVGFAIICPKEIIPQIKHRHWYRFAIPSSPAAEGWSITKSGLLKASPMLECDARIYNKEYFHFKVEGGEINAYDPSSGMARLSQVQTNPTNG